MFWHTNNTVDYEQKYYYVQLDWTPLQECLYNITCTCGSTEAIFLTALLHGHSKVTQLKIIKSIITDDAAIVIKSFLEAN